MNQNISTLGELDEIFGKTSITRQNHGMAFIINAITQTRHFGAVIDVERSDLDSTVFENNTLGNVFRVNNGTERICSSLFWSRL